MTHRPDRRPDRRPSSRGPGASRAGPPGSHARRPAGAGGPENNPRSGPSRGSRTQREVNDERFIARGVRLLYEDGDLIVVDKPAGMVTADPSRSAAAPASMTPSAKVGETLFDFVKAHVRRTARRGPVRRRDDDTRPEDRPGRVWVIHRLDKEATGLLVFAKSLEAFDSLKAEFGGKRAHRIYLAVAEGIIGEPGFASTRQSMINEDRGPQTRQPSRDQGSERLGPSVQPAVTHYRVVASGQDRSLLQVRLETGRKNQIRIHMQELGHPLVGDARFGARTNPINRLGLHAAELGFTHPGTRKQMRFSSPAPASFYRCVGAPIPADGTAREAPPPKEPIADNASKDTSWDSVAPWYDSLLESKGNDHYEQVILPGALALLGDVSGRSVLDLACGQGIFSRRLAALGAAVVGIDAAPKLIDAARARSPEIDFRVGDARALESLEPGSFDAAACIMALGNMDPLGPVLTGVARALKPGGVFVCVLSHPAFRVPGESDWGWDEKRQSQYRRVGAYLSPVTRAIEMTPGRKAAGKGGETTTTFHRPLSTLVREFAHAGLLIDRMDEWCSQRAATSGPRAPEENRVRVEIPLFLGLRAMRPRA